MIEDYRFAKTAGQNQEQYSFQIPMTNVEIKVQSKSQKWCQAQIQATKQG
jgi:hypothetical protein